MTLKRLLLYICVMMLCYDNAVAQIVVPDSATKHVVNEGKGEKQAGTDSLRRDSVPGYGGVFNAIEKIIDSRPALEQVLTDSLGIDVEFDELSKRKKRKLLRTFLGDQFTEWNNIDTTYIMPQLYDFTVMLQTTTSFENFTIKSTGENKQTLKFSPRPGFRLGDYVGWKWIFWGYNVDLNGLIGKNKQEKKQKLSFDFSFYTSKVGLDLYYRRTGNNFECTNLNHIFNVDNPRPDGLSDQFSALDIQTRGFNLYYIFNHRHFSYPAAFAQSTTQRRSAGTFKLGFSFTHHKATMNESKISEKLLPYIEPSILFNTVKYNDYALNFGYAYNWVFAKNWLLGISLSPGLAYNVTFYNADKIADGSNKEQDSQFRHFSLDKLNIDFITRMGLVYNDNKHFFGMAFRFHSFDYRNRHVNMNNSFAYLHFYAGINFKKKKQYK